MCVFLVFVLAFKKNCFVRECPMKIDGPDKELLSSLSTYCIKKTNSYQVFLD